MGDPLSVLGGFAASLQLVSSVAEGLKATIQLVKELKAIPEKLASLLHEVNDSASRLCQSCRAGSMFHEYLDISQTNRLTRCAIALHSVLQNMHHVLRSLLSGSQQKSMPRRQLWKALVYLKLERDLPEKLQRLNRLNLEMIRELGIIGLESNIMTNTLIKESNVSSINGLNTIESKIHDLQSDFQKFTFSTKSKHLDALETIDPSFSHRTEARFNKDTNKDGSCTCSSSEYEMESISGPNIISKVTSISKNRIKQMQRYLAGDYESVSVTELHLTAALATPDANLCYMILSIRTFYTPGNFDLSSFIIRPKFWEDTDLAIYLMKVSEGLQQGASVSRARGFQILKAATTEVFDIFREGAASILIELLSTLSPVNTASCAFVREGILCYLWELAQETLPRSHPFSIVIEKLKNDQGDKSITLRALHFLVGRLCATVGPLHVLSHLGLYRLCGLLRRSGDLAGASRVANDGIQAIRALLGPGSLQERWLLRQLEHVHMDQSDWAAALSVCFDIVGQRSTNIPSPDPGYHDECAVKTMEDIAKTCECAGNPNQAIAWLQQAYISAGMIWGDTQAVAHIHDKIRELEGHSGDADGLGYWVHL